MRGFWDWVGRVIMLVLAGMITLSIIGAIAAIPSGSLPQQVRFERESWPVARQREEPIPPPPPEVQAEAPQPASEAQPRGPVQTVAPAPAAREEVKPAEWLEAITYALLALVGIAAFATLLLLRALFHWRRSADALEALAGRR